MILTRVGVDPDRVSKHDWFWSVPAIAALRDDGLSLDTPVTVLVGENGSGKSTLMEGLAGSWRWRLNAAVQHWGPPASSEDSSLQRCLTLQAENPRPQGVAS